MNVSPATHDAFMDENESGTEAVVVAGITGVQIESEPEPLLLIVAHQFIFTGCKRYNFVHGVVMDPTAWVVSHVT